MDTWKIWLLSIYFLTPWANGQLQLYGCPNGWVHSGNTCYKFETNSPKVYEEAAVDCWMDGATLLSVNNQQEHAYISNFLGKIHSYRPKTWLTSGLYSSNVVSWEGDNSISSEDTYWIRQPQTDEVFSRVAYQIGARLYGGYGWNLVSASIAYNYICEIPQTQASQIDAYKRDIGYGVGAVDKNLIISGPHLISEPVGVVIVGSSGNSIYLECDARANPSPTYKWYRGPTGNESITATTNSRYTLSGGRLTIQNPEVNDANFFRCSVENDQGVILSRVAQIMFGYLHQFSPVRPDDAWGTQSEGVKIACQAPGYNPAVRYSWYKFRSNNWVYPGHPYHFVSQAGYLYFSEVQFTDDRQYFCIVTLTARQGMVKSSEQPVARTSFGRYLVIKPGKNAGGYGPIIHTHTFPSPALKGNTIRMECIAYGSLPLSYSWYREDGRPLPKGSQITNRNRVLTIPNAHLDAEGNYVCRCKRPGAVATKVIALQMEAIPYFPIDINDMLADPGQTIIWRCRAVARPAATYTWYKNGQLITYVPGKIEQKGSNLMIYNIAEEQDEGMYQCAASNQHGTTFSTGQLKVLSFKPNFHRYPLPAETLGPLGGNITIACKAEGAPLPMIVWEKNGGQLSVQPGFTGDRLGMDARNGLVIRGLQYSDAGRYTCKATNINGEATNNTFLRVVSGVVITQAPVPTSVQVNKTAFLYCQASYNNDHQDLVYTWSFNGHPVDNKNKNYHFVQDMSLGVHGLYIREAQFTDQGQYRCEARSPLHTDAKSAFLSVLGPPGMPAGVYVVYLSITTYSARIVWTMGAETSRGVPMIGYDIEAESQFHPGIWNVIAVDIQEVVTINAAQDYSLRKDQRTYTVTNLVPNNSYRFRIRGINEYGRGPEASIPSTFVKIPASAPIKVPSDISGGGGQVGTLTIKWTPLDIADHCSGGIGYKVYYKLHGQKLQAEQHGSHWLKAAVEGNQGQYVAIVGLENYYLQYDVMVGAYNDIGDGPNSTTVVVYSAEGLPVAVPTITSVNSYNQSSIEVVWDPVPDNRLHMKGRIRGYTVQYYWNVAGTRPVDGYQPVKFRWRNTHGNATSVILIDLEMNSEFYFRMQVFNSAGRGPKGEWRRGESLANAPLKYPMFVKVYAHTKHSVRVTWRGISVTLNEESLLGYVIKWWKISSDIRAASRKTVGWVMETTVEGLQSQTVYVLRVAGWSGGGDGQMSDPVYFTVLGGVIQIDPTTSQICYGDQSCNITSAHHFINFWTLLTCIVICICLIEY